MGSESALPGRAAATSPTELAVPADLFIIADGDQHLLYAPFSLGVASVDAETARRIQQARDGQASLDGFDGGYLQALVDAGILTGREQARLRPAFPQKTAFDPDGITLFLTTKCSLGCTYCYASANERPSVMSWETAKAALDWILNHTKARGRDRMLVMFHGGGEVTVAFDLLKRAVEYARAEGEARGIQVTTSAGLNGVMKGPLLEWVIANIDDATVSIDGLPEIHNQQRPLVNGRDSFDIVAGALQRMDEAGFHYGLRVTVTRASVGRLAEAVEFMCERFKTPSIQLEPVASSGRARGQDAIAPDPLEFIAQFRLAREVGRRYGREIKYSGARFGTVTNGFCQSSDDLLAVTTDGMLSGCYEVGQSDDPRAELFLYGRLDQQKRDLDLDMKKVIRLRTLSVEHKSGCDTCFCRWSCAGECSAKLAQDGDAWQTGYSSRCTINRALTLDQMKEYLDGVVPSPAPPALVNP
jgi:uncharacterized protein